MRLFIAIPLPPSLKTVLTRIQSVLRTRGVQGNFTTEDNLHLTLAFIGEYPDPEPVLEVLFSVPFDPFPLTLDGLGAFHQVWWMGIRENPELDAYVKRLRRPQGRRSVCGAKSILHNQTANGIISLISAQLRRPAFCALRRRLQSAGGSADRCRTRFGRSAHRAPGGDLRIQAEAIEAFRKRGSLEWLRFP